MTIEENHLKVAKEYLEKFGKISPVFLQRKLKVNYEKANEIYMLLSEKQLERVSIDVLDLSVRTNNVLNHCGILFIDELKKMTADELLKFRNFGLKCLREVRKELAKYGTCLKNDYLANIENEKKLIEDLPHLIGQIKNEVRDLNDKVKNLYLTLDQLHLDMSTKG